MIYMILHSVSFLQSNHIWPDTLNDSCCFLSLVKGRVLLLSTRHVKLVFVYIFLWIVNYCSISGRKGDVEYLLLFALTLLTSAFCIVITLVLVLLKIKNIVLI